MRSGLWLLAKMEPDGAGWSMLTDRSLLERFFDWLEESTGLRICIYDLGYFTLENERLRMPYPRRTHCSDYCMAVKSDPEAFKRCIKTESWRIERASRQSKPFVHRCYAGVTDLVVPIKVGTRLVGAIFIGQCGLEEGAESGKILSRLVTRYPSLATKALVEAMRTLPKGGAEALREKADVLRFAADYVRQALSSVVSETVVGAQMVCDARGRVRMDRVPNYFLDQLSPGEGAMRKALGQIRANYWRDVNLPNVAAEVGLSESHFSRVFRGTLGMTFRRCLVEARLSAAGWLTKKTDLKIKEIADLVGYDDVSSLSRALRVHAGVTPRSLKNRQPMPWHMNQSRLMPTIVGTKSQETLPEVQRKRKKTASVKMRSS
ncbi:MAG: PocR ligand-binding domain-containing protein [Opitutaceae bacterium]|jgi:AraC-like DNA-binding protein/ligand-binding sensor protein